MCKSKSRSFGRHINVEPVGGGGGGGGQQDIGQGFDIFEKKKLSNSLPQDNILCQIPTQGSTVPQKAKRKKSNYPTPGTTKSVKSPTHGPRMMVKHPALPTASLTLIGA